MLRRVVADYGAAAAERQLSLEMENLEGLPLIAGDRLAARGLREPGQQCHQVHPRWRPGRPARAGVWWIPAGDRVEVQVQDTGIGIDPDHQELIFEKFYHDTVALHSTGETKFMGGGTGLGLAIVRGIVNAHGGRIWVESPGHDQVSCPGSTFFVRLPLAGNTPFQG